MKNILVFMLCIPICVIASEIKVTKEEIVSFIEIKNIHVRKTFADGYTLYNNKGIITEKGKQSSRLFSANDVVWVAVKNDSTINIVLKSDVFQK